MTYELSPRMTFMRLLPSINLMRCLKCPPGGRSCQVIARTSVKEQTEACRIAEELNAKVVSYQYERIRRGTNVRSESAVETRV